MGLTWLSRNAGGLTATAATLLSQPAFCVSGAVGQAVGGLARRAGHWAVPGVCWGREGTEGRKKGRVKWKVKVNFDICYADSL